MHLMLASTTTFVFWLLHNSYFQNHSIFIALLRLFTERSFLLIHWMVLYFWSILRATILKNVWYEFNFMIIMNWFVYNKRRCIYYLLCILDFVCCIISIFEALTRSTRFVLLNFAFWNLIVNLILGTIHFGIFLINLLSFKFRVIFLTIFYQNGDPKI